MRVISCKSHKLFGVLQNTLADSVRLALRLSLALQGSLADYNYLFV